MPLTVKQVQNAKAGRLSDGRGLYMLVKPSGAKSWVLRVQHGGRRRDWGLGSVTIDPIPSQLPVYLKSTLTLAEAREKARVGRELAKAGFDPSKHWRAQSVPDVALPTFREVAKRHHLELHDSWRNKKHRAQWLKTLEDYAFPELGELSVDSIDAGALQKVLLPIWLNKPETARRVKQRMMAVLDYAHAQGWRKSEAPKGALNQLLRGLKQPRGRNFDALNYRELPNLVAVLRQGEETVGRLALQFLILTVARSGEVRGATWKEINLDEAVWTIDGSRMKGGKTHTVPLVPAAVQILNRIKAVASGNPAQVIFPGLKGKPLSDATLAKVLRTTKLADKATVHGLRSTFTDWAAECDIPEAWAEAALAHKIRDKTQAAYRRTTYVEQRREKLMPAWASFVLADKSNVISLAEKRA